MELENKGRRAKSIKPKTAFVESGLSDARKRALETQADDRLGDEQLGHATKRCRGHERRLVTR